MSRSPSPSSSTGKKTSWSSRGGPPTTPLIFLEGVSGVGKTSAAKILRSTLTDRGLRVLAYLEGDGENPVDLFGCAYLSKNEFQDLLQQYPREAGAIRARSLEHGDYVLVRYRDRAGEHFEGSLCRHLEEREGFYRPREPIPLSRYVQVYQDLWRGFTGSHAASTDVSLFDGCFLYHRMNDLVGNYGADDEGILHCLLAILSAMHPHKPLLFYLHSRDPGHRLADARKARGQEPASALRIEEEKVRARRQEAILMRLPVKIARFDISDGWDAAIEGMLQIAEDALGGPSVGP